MTRRGYPGSCHCGRARFAVTIDLDCVRACDCSICRRRGALIVRVDEADLELITPLEVLSVYRWHTGTAADYFCPICGILPFRRPRARTQGEIAAGMPPFTGWSVNARCLEGVNLTALPVQQIHGSVLD